MNKIEVTIRCRQVVCYDQVVEMDLEDYEKIKNLDGSEDIDSLHNEEEFLVLEQYLDLSDIVDSDQEFLEVEVKTA